MDKHLRELLKLPDEVLDEVLASDDPVAPSLLMFSREEVDSYNAAFFRSDLDVCERIIAVVRGRVRDLREFRTLKANLKRQQRNETPDRQEPYEVEAPLLEEAESEQDLRRLLDNLRDWHRFTAEALLVVNRELLLASQDRGQGDIEELTQRRELLQARLKEIDAQILKEARHLDSLRQEDGAGTPVGEGKSDKGLIRVRHPNRDFFLADLFDYAMKDDGASMEAPIFTLSTKPDLSIWEWRSKDGSKYVKVAPSVLGRATQHDKDILIYVISQLVEGMNRGREDARNRTVRFTVYDFLVTTNRDTSGTGYQRLHEAFERLRGTTITTDIRTGGTRIREGFGIIDAWRIIEKSPTDERMIAVEVTLSRWLYNAVQAYEVLTIHPDYFRLRKPMARRLYELARKHCGHQTKWTVSLDLLQEKTGSKSSLREFRRALRAIQDEDSLPEYRLVLGEDDLVTFYVRDTKRLVRGLAQRIGRKG